MKKTTLMEFAYDQIKSGIFEGKFERNKIYSAQFFADYLDISRTPVREAILQLRDEGLVDILQNRGIVIKEISPERLYQISQIRVAVDGYCAAYLAENIHSLGGISTLNELNKIYSKQFDVLQNDDCKSDSEVDAIWYNLDSLFHSTLNGFSNNSVMINLISDFDSYLRYVGLVTAGLKDRKFESMEENSTILSAINAGDACAAFMAAKFHVEQIYSKMLASMNTSGTKQQ